MKGPSEQILTALPGRDTPLMSSAMENETKAKVLTLAWKASWSAPRTAIQSPGTTYKSNREAELTLFRSGDGTLGSEGGLWYQEKVPRWNPRWGLHVPHSICKIIEYKEPQGQQGPGLLFSGCFAEPVRM